MSLQIRIADATHPTDWFGVIDHVTARHHLAEELRDSASLRAQLAGPDPVTITLPKGAGFDLWAAVYAASWIAAGDQSPAFRLIDYVMRERKRQPMLAPVTMRPRALFLAACRRRAGFLPADASQRVHLDLFF